MEIRKVVIVESGGQRKRTIETSAETLGQLKNDLISNGIDFEGKTFFEGLSKTELLQDDSLLPRDIPRNGTTTNNLVFMLTTPQKKIKSGSMNRQEAYTMIKELGLGEECIRKFGKNFTLCKTEDLINLINGNMPQVIPPHHECCNMKEEAANTADVKMAIKELVHLLYCNGIFDAEECDMVISHLDSAQGTEPKSPYTDAELEDIIRELNL